MLDTNKKREEIWPYAYVGYDSRDSSYKLAAAVKKGLSAMKVPFTDFKMQTVPCFKFLVENRALEYNSQDYISRIVEAYLDFMALCEEKSRL